MVLESVPKSVTLKEIKLQTNNDSILTLIMGAIKNNSWHKAQKEVSDHDLDALMSFKMIKDELSVNSDENVILRDTRLVIQKSLQTRIVNIAHEGHQGVVKCKQLLRDKVWFPGIDGLVIKIVNQCISCQCNTPNYTREPYIMSPLPTSPWGEVSIDFKKLSHTQYLLVVTDDYSRYLVVESVNSTSSHHVIPVFDNIFSMFGVPEIVKSDNGPPFQGGEFHKCAQYLGFTHCKITLYHPRANGECERFMITLGKVVKIAATESQPFNQLLCRFLRSY